MNNVLSEKHLQAVNSILVEEIGITETQITIESRIEQDLGADSLTMVEIMMKLEDRFGISAPDESWDRISTVGDLYEVVADLLAHTAR
jgi:acyl carrier protein